MTPSQENISERQDMIDTLKSFLTTAPNGQGEAIKQHVLATTGESITCVRWNDAFYITGTDIVRCLVFRFYAFGRPVQNLKKFEEGIFSDLRNLKPGTDAILEEPKSPFLDLLFKNNCIRTQKKQKVFFWYSVPHDRLFLDALERDLKREKLGIYPTSVSVAHPAEAISLDTTQAMFDEFRKSMLSEMNLQPFYHHGPPSSASVTSETSISDSSSASPDQSQGDIQKSSSATTIFGQFSLFEGSPTYKQRRRRTQKQQESKYIRSKKPEAVIWSSDTSNNNTDDDTGTLRYFHCPLPACAKHFKRLEHMKRHLRTHTMERPYLCDLCGKRFSRSDNLAQHKKTHQRLRSIKGEQQDDDEDDEDSSSDDRYISKNHGKFPKQVTSIRRAVNMTTMNYHSSGGKRIHSDIEYMKAEPVLHHLVVPELSTSTTSSCESSPIYTRPLPTIKIEDTEIFYDLSTTNQMNHDSAMMMVEELLPQQSQYWQENESASDWQRRVDWNQYATFDYSYQDIQPYYYYGSPLFGTTASNSTVTTAANSPVTRTLYHYSDNPTMTPSDALLQH